MSNQGIRTSLSKHVAIAPMTDDEIRRKAARLFHETGTVMLNPAWLLNDLDRQHLINIAEKLYGRRGNVPART